MPPPPPEVFLDAVLSTVRANAHYVPPQGKGSLYLRPLLMGTGPILGLGPAPSYTLIVYAAAVGSYFKVTPAPRSVSAHFAACKSDPEVFWLILCKEWLSSHVLLCNIEGFLSYSRIVSVAPSLS